MDENTKSNIISNIIKNSEITSGKSLFENALQITLKMTVPEKFSWRIFVDDGVLSSQSGVKYPVSNLNKKYGCTNCSKFTFLFDGNSISYGSEFTLYYRDVPSCPQKSYTWIMEKEAWRLK